MPTAASATTTSTTCFLNCENQFLFVHRTKKGNSTDVGRLNGIGGKLEPGEDFLSCAIRETFEETGFRVTPTDCLLKAIVSMKGGYPEDWLMCFFTVKVRSLQLPIGHSNDEGELIWLSADEVLTAPYQLVDDLHYCWPHIANVDTRVLYAGCLMHENQTIKAWQSHLL